MVTCWPSLVLAIIVGSASASASSLAAAAATGRLPSLTELGSAWVDPNKEVSAAAAVGPEQRDLATINNFWGAGGIAPQTLRPVDLVAVNSLELPPYSGCGASMHAGSPSGFGCGRMLVDGVQVAAASTRWQSHEAGRRSAPLAGSSVTVESAMRMPFEQNGVIWEVNFTAAAQQAATIRIDFELAGMMNKRPTVGTWVYPTINTASSFNYTALADSGSGQKGVLSCGGGSSGTAAARDACTRFVFVGPRQPDQISISPHAPPPPPPPPPAPSPSPGLGGCSIAGLWIQEPSTTFGPIVEDKTSGAFSWTNDNSTETQKFGWDRLNGTVSKEGKIAFHYYHTKARGGAPTPEHGSFFGDCDHVKVSDACWHRTTAKPDPACHHHLPAPPPAPEGPSPVPNASFSAVHIQAGETVTIRLALAVGEDAAGAAAAEREFAADLATFNTAFAEAHSKWQERWALAFKPENGYWSGHMPTLSLPGSSNVERVYYMSALTVVSQMRTNLPLVGPRVWPNGNGNVAFGGARGIGGSRSWWWDESLTSIMLALLEPASRAPTFQAWLAHDDHPGTKFGHGMGNGYPMDCAPIGKGGSKWGVGCGWKNASNGVRPPPPPPPPLRGPEYGFYCYNPWAYYTMASNHLRINNDTKFLGMQAASSNMTVEEALEGIATDFQEYLIPGTNLVDYGPSMDGFSPTYKHVMPGCSQGNSVWMLRDFAAYRESQGGAHAADAARLRQMAAGLAKDTMEKMYQARDGHGWFNVIFPPGAATDHGTPEDSEGDSLTVMQMRHVVDFFSVTFGLCGITQPGSSLCDFSAQVRRELGDWFRGESVTSTWIRATSPKTNCSTSYTVPKEATAAMVAAAAAREQASSQLQADGGDAEWPAYTTCKAGRPDHGSNGAYPSWPAFAVEALCYVDGNCSSAFQIMGSFVQATHEGPFGQAHEVPQLSTAPYTPFDAEPSFKPTAGVTRYVAIEGGSFFDAVVRGFFGYHAPLQWGGVGSGSAQDELTAALHNAEVDRGFVGTLSNLRTPHGLATIVSGPKGLSIKLQPSDERA